MPSRVVKVVASIIGGGLVACIVLVMIVIGLVPVLQVLYQGHLSHDFIDYANRLSDSRTVNFQFEYPMVVYTTLLGTKKPPSAMFVTTHLLDFHIFATTPPMIARFLLQKFGITARVVCYDNYSRMPVTGKTVDRLVKEQIRIPRQHPQKLEYTRDQIALVLGRGESVILFCDTHRHRSDKRFRTFYAKLLEHFPQYPKCYVEMKAKRFSRNVHGIFHPPTLEVQKVIELHNKIVFT